jgi:hypothetical protein
MIGMRVVTPSGDVGVVEEADDGMVKVRLMTPDNEPSCLSSWCFPDQLADGTNVLPQPMSKAWKAKAALFCHTLALTSNQKASQRE